VAGRSPQQRAWSSPNDQEGIQPLLPAVGGDAVAAGDAGRSPGPRWPVWGDGRRSLPWVAWLLRSETDLAPACWDPPEAGSWGRLPGGLCRNCFRSSPVAACGRTPGARSGCFPRRSRLTACLIVTKPACPAAWPDRHDVVMRSSSPIRVCGRFGCHRQQPASRPCRPARSLPRSQRG
jgi:hypothetical protein